MILSSAYGMLNKQSSLNPEEEKEAQHRFQSHEDIAFSPFGHADSERTGSHCRYYWNDHPHGRFFVEIPAHSFGDRCRQLQQLLGHADFQYDYAPDGTNHVVKAFTRIMGFILLCVGVQFMVKWDFPLLIRALCMDIKILWHWNFQDVIAKIKPISGPNKAA